MMIGHRFLGIRSIVMVVVLIAGCVFAQAKTALSIDHDAFQYSGEYTDQESNLQYLSARYYNPKIPRFISRDSYDLVNRYSYVDGDPIMGVDPSGHNTELMTGLAAGLGGAGALFSPALGVGVAGGLELADIVQEFKEGDTTTGAEDSFGFFGATLPGILSTNPEILFPYLKDAAAFNAHFAEQYGNLAEDALPPAMDDTEFRAYRKRITKAISFVTNGLGGTQLAINTLQQNGGINLKSGKSWFYLSMGTFSGAVGGYVYGAVGEDMTQGLVSSYNNGGSFARLTGGSLLMGAARTGLKELVRSSMLNGVAMMAGYTSIRSGFSTIVGNVAAGAIFGAVSGPTSAWNNVYNNAYSRSLLFGYRFGRDLLLADAQNAFNGIISF